jgi:hypothetical protein
MLVVVAEGVDVCDGVAACDWVAVCVWVGVCDTEGPAEADEGVGSAALAEVNSTPALVPRTSPESTAAAKIAGGRIVHLLPFPHRPKTVDS